MDTHGSKSEHHETDADTHAKTIKQANVTYYTGRILLKLTSNLPKGALVTALNNLKNELPSKSIVMDNFDKELQDKVNASTNFGVQKVPKASYSKATSSVDIS